MQRECASAWENREKKKSQTKNRRGRGLLTRRGFCHRHLSHSSKENYYVNREAPRVSMGKLLSVFLFAPPTTACTSTPLRRIAYTPTVYQIHRCLKFFALLERLPPPIEKFPNSQMSCQIAVPGRRLRPMNAREQRHYLPGKKNLTSVFEATL